MSANINTTIASHTQGEPLTEPVDSRHSSLTLGVESDHGEPAEGMDVDGPTFVQVTTQILET